MKSRRYSRILVAVAAVGGAVACADAVGPTRSPDVLGQAGGPPATDSSPSLASDTTLSPGRLRGMVVATSPDSTTTWRPIPSARLDVAQRDARTGAMTVLATTTSNAAGRFVFDKVDVPAGLLFVRATPSSGSTYRATRWLAAYNFVGDWFRVGAVGEVWTLGPYIIVEPSDAPEHDYAPMLLIGRVLGDPVRPVPVAGASVVIERALAPARDTTPATTGPVASGRTDANGFFLITLPGPGLYAARATMPATSPFGDMPMGGTFAPPANPETSVSTFMGLTAGRR